jgi:1,4-dihydroxy-2-naphthoate octaprenyltransferase
MNKWVLATRPWSFPASAMPALLAISFVFFQKVNFDNVSWVLGVLALMGAVCFQIAGNLIGDYFDYKYKVDRKETFGSSRLLVDGVFQPQTIYKFGISALIAGILLGLILMYFSGIQLLWIGLAGALGTYFYYRLKFIALGDLLIFIIYGPLIGLGTAYVMTGILCYELLLIEIPVAFLVVNILHANNTRDIRDDGKANIKTQAMLLGIKGSKIQYIVLALGAYIAVAIMVAFGVLHSLTLSVFLSIPLALKNIKQIQQAEIEKPENIKMLDATSAQLVMIFTLLFSLSNFIAYYL